MSSELSNYPSVSVVDGHDNQTVVPCTTASEAAAKAAENLGLRVWPQDRATLAFRGVGLQDDEPLVDGRKYELIVIGGTV